MTEDIYTNGSAAPGSPAHMNGREVRKVRLVQFEKVTEEPMVSWQECIHPCDCRNWGVHCTGTNSRRKCPVQVLGLGAGDSQCTVISSLGGLSQTNVYSARSLEENTLTHTCSGKKSLFRLDWALGMTLREKPGIPSWILARTGLSHNSWGFHGFSYLLGNHVEVE